MQPRPFLFVAASLPLALAALPQKQQLGAFPTRFERLSGSGPQGIVTLGLTPRDYATMSAHSDGGQPFTLERSPLPGHRTADLELRPLFALAHGARAQVVPTGGRVELVAPRVRCFSGHLVGGGSAFLALTETEMNGYFYAGEELYLVSTQPGAPGRATLAHRSQLGTFDAWPCGFVPELRHLTPGGGSIERAVSAPTLRTADVFIEADDKFRARFASDHLREQTKIRGAMNTSCLATKQLARGDYDGDGDLDVADLTAAETVAAQGFRSLAAEELFDMDADDDMDDRDHDALAQRVYGAPPADVEVRNGSGTNPLVLSALGNPLLGTTWRLQVLASGTGTTNLLVGYDLALTGTKTSRGELLVGTTPYGGTKLFSSTATSNGTYAINEVPLPMDTALFGLEVSFQALVLGAPAGDFYSNALDALLSPWQ